MEKDTTHFGYSTVEAAQKQGKVNAVFHSVANRYDIMNDLMSLGIHRIWKHMAISACQIRPHHQVLDIASGTGDLAKLIQKRLDSQGLLVASDINASMLNLGRDRLIDAGCAGNIQFVQANAELLPFHDNTFDRMTFAFGLRNVTHKDKALASCYKALKPGGRLVVLEFSHPTSDVLKKIYDKYSFSVLPKLGEWVAKDKASYDYLAESIRMHPPQDALLSMMKAAGFDEARYQNLTGGIVAIHQGVKY